MERNGIVGVAHLLIDLAKKYIGKKTLETKKVEADMTASNASFA